MRWRKRDLWKAGITIACMLLLLLFTQWVPLSAASAYPGASRAVTPRTVMVQATLTEDAMVMAHFNEMLEQEIQQLKAQNEPDFLGWLQANASILLSTLAVVIGGLFGLGRWLADRRNEREKRVEELFQAAVTRLGDEKEGTRIGAVILLRTFLRPGYERYYTQVFDLVVANLRLPRTPQEDLAAPLLPTALSHALIVAFVEAFPLAREKKKKTPNGNFLLMRAWNSLRHFLSMSISQKKNATQDQTTPGANHPYKDYKVVRSAQRALVTIPLKEIQSLSARDIRLDNGYLWNADLKQVWMAEAFLRKTDLMRADLRNANLYGADLSGAYLWETDLSEAVLWRAKLCKADLNGTILSKAILLEANLSGASLHQVNLLEANLREANLSGTILEDALCLEGADLRGVTGLTREQLEACKAKGAIIDEDPTTSSPQSTAMPPTPAQNRDEQASSAPSPQENVPPSHGDENSVGTPAQDRPDEIS